MSKFKMRVKEGQTARGIQDYMFSRGVKWSGNKTDYRYLEAEFFFADGNWLTYDMSDKSHFEKHASEEVFLVQSTSEEFKEVPKHSHYHKDVSHLNTIDVYRVMELWGITSPPLQHAIKKLMVPGGRGAGKDMAKDVQEAIDSLIRWQEMQVENKLAKAKEQC